MLDILIVEDRDEDVERLLHSLAALPFDLRWHRAATAHEAREVLQSRHFDLVVCDLRIPASDASGAPLEQHGVAVLEDALVLAPGTPLLILSGFATNRMTRPYLDRRPHEDYLGAGRRLAMVVAFDKDDYDGVADAIRSHADGVDTLRRIDVVSTSELDYWNDRCLRLVTKRRRGVRCSVERIMGGKSGAWTIVAGVSNGGPVPAERVLIKMMSLDRLQREAERYDQYVAGRLPPGGLAHVVDRVTAGAGPLGAIVYSFAPGRSSAYDYLTRPGCGGEVVQRIRDLEVNWLGSAPAAERRLIRDIRRSALLDAELGMVAPRLGRLAWRTLEDRAVDVVSAIQHGDLHADNVLFDETGQPMLIDYADVAEAWSGWDAVSLELSLVVQRDSPWFGGSWPEASSCERWLDIDAYVAGCPNPDVVRGLRAWALDAAGSRATVGSLAYAYLVRQLKYHDIHEGRVLAILKGLVGELTSTTA